MEKDKKKAFYKRWVFWRWIILPALIAFSYAFRNNNPIMITSLVIIVLYFYYLIFSSFKNFYNIPIVGIIFAIIGMAFKFQHWPGAGALLLIGLSCLAFGALYSSYNIVRTIKISKFLKWYGLFIGIILCAFSMGLLFTLQHWPLANIISYISIYFFIVAILAMAFILPSSNYIDWVKKEKKIFYRSVIIPMIFIICLSSLVYFFPNVYSNWSFKVSEENLWDMTPIELLDKDGIL